MRLITLDDFSGRVGKAFEVEVRAASAAAGPRGRCRSCPASGRTGGSFRLEFVGPLSPMLGQGIFPFQIGARAVRHLHRADRPDDAGHALRGGLLLAAGAAARPHPSQS